MKPPKYIYLQFYDDLGQEPPTIDGDITWCWEKISGNDIAYVRAGKSTQELIDEIKRLEHDNAILRGNLKWFDTVDEMMADLEGE